MNRDEVAFIASVYRGAPVVVSKMFIVRVRFYGYFNLYEYVRPVTISCFSYHDFQGVCFVLDMCIYLTCLTHVLYTLSIF